MGARGGGSVNFDAFFGEVFWICFPFVANGAAELGLVGVLG